MAQELQAQQVQQARVPEILRAWGEIDRVFDQMAAGFGLPSLRQFASLTGGRHRQNESLPATDVSENENEYRVAMELPGIDPKDIDVNIEGAILTVRGERRQEWRQQQGPQSGQQGQQEGRQQGNYLISERTYGEVQRTLQLTSDIDRDNIKAEYRNGVLALTLPKSQQARAQRRKIEVQGQG